MVLLKNDEVAGHMLLPLDPTKIQTLAIIRRLANKLNTGDIGSSNVFAPRSVTLYQGLQAALPTVKVILEDTDTAQSAKSAAASADVVICVVGYKAADEGEYVIPSFHEQRELLNLLPPTGNSHDAEVRAAIEGKQKIAFGSGSSDADGLVAGAGGDRWSLRLRDRDVEIVKAASAASSRIMVSVVAAGAVIMEDWLDEVPGVLWVWYSGGEGGHAFADVLLGKVDVGGRMPFSVPRSETHLPHFNPDASNIVYDQWHGQSLLDKLGVDAQFPLGYGLPYTEFTMQQIVVDTLPLHRGLEEFIVQVKVTNAGKRAGDM